MMREHQLKKEIENLHKAIDRKKAEILELVYKEVYYSNLALGLEHGAAREIAKIYTNGIHVEITSPEVEPPKLKDTRVIGDDGNGGILVVDGDSAEPVEDVSPPGPFPKDYVGEPECIYPPGSSHDYNQDPQEPKPKKNADDVFSG